MAYNTINLRHEATFKTCIYKNVYWVPFHTLGESRYQNEELEEMNEKTPFIFGTEIHLNVYEAIQLYQMVRHFEESNDIIIKEFEQVPWQLHKSGKYAYETNHGCCASSAAWLNYVVGDLYSEKGYFQWIRPDGSGHVINYFYVNDQYYLVDMSALTEKNAKYSPIETGKKADYVNSKFSSGACIQVKELEDFINYHRKIFLWKGYEFNYLKKKNMNTIPPCYSYHEKNLLIYLELGNSQDLTMKDFSYESRKYKKQMRIPIEYTDEYN